MNRLIGLIDLGTLVTLLVCAGILARGWRRRLRRDVKVFFALLLALTTIHGVSNVMEWTFALGSMDAVGDVVAIGEPLLWIMFVWSALQAAGEEKLRASRQQYRTLVENVEIGITLVDTDFNIVTTNRAQARRLGKDPSELIGARCHMDFAGRDDVCADCPGAEAMATGRSVEVERELVEPGGTRTYVRIHAFPLPPRDGRPTGFVETVEDITGRREADERVRRSQATISSIFRAAPAGIGMVADRQLMQVNDRLCEMTGHTREELIGRNARCLYPTEEEYLYVGEEKYRQISERGTGTVETRWRRKDGTVIDVLLSSTPLDTENLSAGVTFTALDITSRKNAERDLQDSRDFLQRVIDGVPDAVMVIDTEYRVLLANRAVHDLAGGVDPVSACLSCYQVSHGRDVPCDGQEQACPLQEVVRTGRTVQVQHVHCDSDGKETVVDVVVAPLLDETGQVLHVIESARDVTDLKQAEEQRRALEAQVQHVQKLESLGVLAGGIAHDFNNLLVAVLGNADLALMDMAPAPPVRASLEEIRTAAHRAAELTDQMLAYAGKGQLAMWATDLNELVGEMGHLLEVSISKKAQLRYDLADDLPPIRADASQIRQVVMNLITNASDAIGEHAGVITLRTCVFRADREYLAETYLDEGHPEGDYTLLEVSDTGCGMDATTQAKLFDPFFSTKFTGRGLGMAAVLGIVRGHKGAIDVQSEVGQGTTFRILLPVSDQPAEVADTAPVLPAGEREQGEGTILVADDEEGVRTVARAMLERHGYDVLVAEDGRQAVEVFREKAGEIRAVLLDMTMPYADGMEAFEEIRRTRPDAKVILCSGYSEGDAMTQFADKGLYGFLQKPFDVGKLLAAVRTALAS